MSDKRSHPAGASTLRRPIDPAVRRSSAYADLLSWMEETLRRPRLHHGTPNYAHGSRMYWEIGEKIVSFGVRPGLFASLARDLRARLPPGASLGTSQLSVCGRFYRAYAGDPQLAALARDLSEVHNRIILYASPDPVAREFYIRLDRALRWRGRELRGFIADGLFEQVEAAYGQGGGRAWLDRVLGAPEAPPPTRQAQILELLRSDPRLTYVAIANSVGVRPEYVRVVALQHGLGRAGDYSAEQYRRSAAIAARQLGLPVEEYRARRAAGQRWCSSCKQWLPRERFERPRTGAPQGSFCILCLKEYMSGRAQRRQLEEGETPLWMIYRDWWGEIHGRLGELPPEWQQAFLDEGRPTLASMARALGLRQETFRKRWLARGLPPPPPQSHQIRWEFEPATLLGE